MIANIMTFFKKIFIAIILTFVVYTGYLYFRLTNSTYGLDESSILTNCSSKEYETNERLSKFGLVPSSIACILRNYFAEDIVKPGDELIYKLEMYSITSRQCNFDYFIDKKEQLFCFLVFRDILLWFEEKKISDENDDYLNLQIKWLDEKIKYNINNPWEKLFPELNEINDEKLKDVVRWFDSMSNEDGWSLTKNEQLKLLGGIKNEEFQELLIAGNSKKNIQLGEELVYRLILLKGIYDVLENKTSTHNDATSSDWFIMPNQNHIFKGKSPKEYIIFSGTIVAVFNVRGYLKISKKTNI